MVKEKKSKEVFNSSTQQKEKNMYSQQALKILKENREKRLKMYKNL